MQTGRVLTRQSYGHHLSPFGRLACGSDIVRVVLSRVVFSLGHVPVTRKLGASTTGTVEFKLLEDVLACWALVLCC